MKRLFLIDVGYACYGMESTDNIITLVAPMAQWMLHKSLQEVKPWLIKKKAKVVECNSKNLLTTNYLQSPSFF